MTIQLVDSITFEGAIYSIRGVSGEGLFNPEKLGLKTYSFSSACWKGYFCNYYVENNILYLTNIVIGLADSNFVQGTPKICGKEPIRKVRKAHVIRRNMKQAELADIESDEYFVENVHTPMVFSGGLIVAAGYDDELIQIYGNTQLSALTLIELIFDQGKLVKITDHSKSLVNIRSKATFAVKNHELIAQQLELLQSEYELDY